MPSNSLTFNLIDTQAARGSTFHVEAARFEESSGFFLLLCGARTSGGGVGRGTLTICLYSYNA